MSNKFPNSATQFWCIDQMEKGGKPPLVQLKKFDNRPDAVAAFATLIPLPGKSYFLGRYVGVKLQATLDHK